jgi:hypothetical protein
MRTVTFSFTALTMFTSAFTLATLHSAEARACSPAEITGVSPADGAVDVPTNAKLFFAISDIPSNATLVDEETDERTELQVTFDAPVTEMILAPLLPSRAYRVELDIFDNGNGVLEAGRTLRFTTAAAADDAAPALTTIDTSVSSEKVPGGLTFGEGCSLAPLPYWREERVQSLVTFDVEVSADTELIRLFRVIDGERAARSVTFTNGATSVQISDFTTDEGEATYRIVAVDGAGNATSEDVVESLGLSAAGGCAQINASTAAPIVALLVLLRRHRRIRRIGRAA